MSYDKKLTTLRKKKKNAIIEIWVCLLLLAAAFIALMTNKDPNSDLTVAIIIVTPVLFLYCLYASAKFASSKHAIRNTEIDIENQRIQEENEKIKAEIVEQIKAEETPDPEKQKILDEMNLDEEMRKAQNMIEGQSQSPWRILTTGLIAGGVPGIWIIVQNTSGTETLTGLAILGGIALFVGAIALLASNFVQSNNKDNDD